MKLNLDEIMSGHSATANPTQATAISKDIAVGLKNMSGIGAALAGNFARVAVNTGIQQQTKDLNDLNTQVAEFADTLASKTAESGQQTAAVALGQQEQQQAIAESAASPEAPVSEQQAPVAENNQPEETSSGQAEELPPPPEEVLVDLGNIQQADAASVMSTSEEEIPFSLEDMRMLIREHDCLKHSYHTTNPGQNIASDFEIREKDARGIVNHLLAKQKQGKLAEMKNGERALKFLQEEYTPAA